MWVASVTRCPPVAALRERSALGGHVCIRIAVVNELPTIATWDPDEVTILVSRGTHPHDLIRELHAILVTDLGAPDLPGAGLHCFCGDPVTLPRDAELVPALAGAPTL